MIEVLHLQEGENFPNVDGCFEELCERTLEDVNLVDILYASFNDDLNEDAERLSCAQPINEQTDARSAFKLIGTTASRTSGEKK